jgi:conjugal transfer pilus assembly protein TraU
MNAITQRLAFMLKGVMLKVAMLKTLHRAFASVALLCISLFVISAKAYAGESCHGKFINPITDICWSCTLPLTIGGQGTLSLGQEDRPNPSGSTFCACTSPARVGVKTGFWEPSRMVEITRTPYCMVALGGKEFNVGLEAPRAARPQHKGNRWKSSFYQVHWYINPVWYYLEVLTDHPCLEPGSLDIAYMTEVDPLWADDELTLILNPDANLFANPIAQAACAADCVAASAGFPIPALYWCAGCQGSMYPLNGHVGAHVGGIQASSLLMQRMTAKLHREGLMWAASDNTGLCSYYPEPLMDKTKYKSQLVYPVPATQKIAGKCCQPYGRTTTIWGSGKEFPVKGEDFAYQIFRKRNCCTGTENY